MDEKTYSVAETEFLINEHLDKRDKQWRVTLYFRTFVASMLGFSTVAILHNANAPVPWLIGPVCLTFAFYVVDHTMISFLKK